MIHFFNDDKPRDLPPPKTIAPPTVNVEELARQKKVNKKRRTNRDDFIIQPTEQGIRIPS